MGPACLRVRVAVLAPARESLSPAAADFTPRFFFQC